MSTNVLTPKTVTDYLSAQTGVLGSVLIDDSVAGMVIHRTREEDYIGVGRSIYRAMRDIFLAGGAVDPVTVRAKLGQEYDQTLMEIVDCTPTARNVDAYVNLLLEASRLRQLRELGGSLQVCSDLEEAKAILDKINRAVVSRPAVRVVTMEQGLADFYQRQQEIPDIIPWGMPGLDGTVRTEPGDFLVIGGYASAGKTALSLQLAWSQAKDRRVGYFSLETKPEKMIDRTVTMVTGINFGRIKEHALTKEDWIACSGKVKNMRERKLEIIQAGGLTVADIRGLALAKRYDLVYIDYLQLIRPDDRRAPLYEQVTQISMALHTMAQTTGITIVALSQLTRPEKSGQQEKAPGLHSLRQSGQIEQDADAVLLLYKEDPTKRYSRRVLKIAKNKDGESGGTLTLDFNGATQTFTRADTTKDTASQLSAAGRAVKDANRAKAQAEHQQMNFEELPDGDYNVPF